MPTPGHPQVRFAVNASWLIRLRWAAVCGQLVTIWAVWAVFNVHVPLVPLIILLAVTACTNLALELWTRTVRDEPIPSWSTGRPERTLVLVMALDLLVLTLLLYYSGGAANPFSVFYLVNLSLAAICLRPRSVWALTAFAIAGFALLGFVNTPIKELENVLVDSTKIGDLGRFTAFGTCAVVIVYFVTRLTKELRERERELREADQQQAKAAKLEALGTLAAGAAHELATPLSTIAVVVKELERRMLQSPNPEASTVEDIGLVRDELNRCRSILDQLALDSGHVRGEALTRFTLKSLLDKTIQDLRRHSRIATMASEHEFVGEIFGPLNVLAQALRGLLRNALDASPANEKVVLRAERHSHEILLTIEDRGAGMPRDVLQRVGEPFYTTKEPGQGMGLGVFLAQSVVERMGGKMTLDSKASEGTIVTVRLPLVSDPHSDAHSQASIASAEQNGHGSRSLRR